MSLDDLCSLFTITFYSFRKLEYLMALEKIVECPSFFLLAAELINIIFFLSWIFTDLDYHILFHKISLMTCLRHKFATLHLFMGVGYIL